MLRSTNVPDLVPTPGIEGLEELAEQARLAGVDVELQIHIAGGGDAGRVSVVGEGDAGRVLAGGDGSSGVKGASGAFGTLHESLGAAGDAERAGDGVGGRGMRGLDHVGYRGETTSGGWVRGRGDEGGGAGVSGWGGRSSTAIEDEAGAVGGRQGERHHQRDRLPDGVGLSVYRIVQEALTNVAKHAAPARCRVSVVADGKDVRIEVIDDGPGRRTSPSVGTGHGLIGMRERVMMYGGTFEAGGRPGSGFRVFAQLPYQETP
ncbi:hypothetical protein E1294_10385 [Nonomuraea diastatica]|uniref:histidine kinase n=2 Tax=Nonomuraea diastatica TaxID=1848329 RepID=A0A4R4WYP0_9ACTN|nr:hypothetical protein E1294_10385 [Nonomuraea diastatica]